MLKKIATVTVDKQEDYFDNFINDMQKLGYIAVLDFEDGFGGKRIYIIARQRESEE